MRIAFVYDDSLDRPDGVTQYVLTLSKELINMGHEVAYFVGETKRQDLKNVYSLARNVRVSFSGNKLSVPLPVSKKSITSALDEFKPDVIHVQLPCSPFMGERIIHYAKRQTNPPKVVSTFHILPFSRFSRVGNRLLGSLQKSTLLKIDHNIAVSSPAADFAASAYGLRCQVIPNMVNTRLFRKGSKKHVKGRIVMVGRMDKRKGHKQLIAALSALKHKNGYTKFEAQLAGRWQLRQRVSNESRASAFNISDNVVFIGEVTEQEKAELLSSAELAVFPSTAGESFGIVLIEAIAAGSEAVLGGNNPGYASVLASCPEALFDPNSTVEFAGKLELFLKDSKLREELHSKQQALIQKFSSVTVAKQIEEVYDSLLSKV